MEEVPVKKTFLFTVAVLLGSASLVVAQAPPPAMPKADAPVFGSPTFAFDQCGDNSCNQLWGSAEYLMWWTKGSPIPPLAITGPNPASAGPIIGPILFNPGSPGFGGLQTITGVPGNLGLGSATKVLIDDDIDSHLRSGARFTIGGWISPSGCLGLEGSYFSLLSKTVHVGVASRGNAPLAIPFVDATTGLENGYTLASPGTTNVTRVAINTTPDVFVNLFTNTTMDTFGGGVGVTSSSRLQGSEINAVWNSDMDCCVKLQVLAGLRWVQLEEGLGITSFVSHNQSDVTLIQPELGIAGRVIGTATTTNQFSNISSTQTTRVDQFDTHNNFYGGQVGVRGEYRWNQLSLIVGAKVALGEMHETAEILGATSTTVTSTLDPTVGIRLAGIPFLVGAGTGVTSTTTTTTASAGGLFAQPFNIGHYSRDAFAVIPEGNIKIGYQLNESLRATVGYTFLYISEVARPGDQIDRGINPALLASPPALGFPLRPLFGFKGSNYWAQGVDLGLEFQF
jgi:hypothetical protein